MTEWVFCFTFFSPLASSLQSLCQVLDASVSMGSRVLETQLDSLLLALHQQVHQRILSVLIQISRE